MERGWLGRFDIVEPGSKMLLHPALYFSQAKPFVGESENKVGDFAIFRAVERPIHQAIMKIGVAHESIL